MDRSEIAALLGRASTDVEVDAVLTRFGIDDRPEVVSDLRDPDGPVVELQVFVDNYALGIEFGFDDEAAWQGWDEFEWGKHPMLLTQIYLYGDHKGVRPYHARLPDGLHLADDRSTVRVTMAAFESTRRSYVRDLWELPEFSMVVSYVAAGTHIDFILCLLREPPLPVFDYSLAPAPPVDTIIQLIGKACDDPAFRQVFVQLGFDACLEEVRDHRSASLRRTYGVDLGFSKPAGQARAAKARNPIFSHVMFYRARELDARGWQGYLPHGISFDDSPEVALQKVGIAPDEQVDGDFTGYVLWHLPDYSLYLYYSTMENVILRAQVMAPGLWTAWGVPST
ncbi:MAG TPA: hypothetical protein VF800_28640 [Telluria sp.]|jgi:hypothetical protein